MRLGISWTNADSQWNPVYNAFHRNFVVETNRFVSSTVNVNLTRQTCGQCTSRAAESKRRALENHFSEWICYTFPMSECREYWNLGLCTNSVLAKREPRSNGDCKKKYFACFFVFLVWNPLDSAPITSGTNTDGGTVMRKPGSARRKNWHLTWIFFIIYFLVLNPHS